VTVRWPQQEIRLVSYEAAAKTSFDAEEPGSTIRRRVFREA
jgi:hypothetical protein